MLKAAKKTDTKHGAVASREESVGRFIPYTRHIDDTTLKTKEGYLLKIIKLEGLPFETADQIDLNARKNVRATLLHGLSNSRFAVYHHILRREVSDELDGFFENDWCRDLDNAYQERLAKKRMFVNEQYITIVRRPAQSKIGFLPSLPRHYFLLLIVVYLNKNNLKIIRLLMKRYPISLPPCKPINLNYSV